jgi:hypothetical protein
LGRQSRLFLVGRFWSLFSLGQPSASPAVLPGLRKEASTASAVNLDYPELLSSL